jgi:ATP-binding cassette subfamily B protein
MRRSLARHDGRGAPPSSHRRLAGVLLHRRRSRLAGLGVLLGVSSALPLAGPQLLRAFVDQAAARRPLGVLGLIAGGYVAVALVRQALAVAATYGATQLAWAAANELRGTLVRHSLELDLSFHGIHPPGELLERVDGDVTALSSFVSSFLLRVVGSSLTLAGVLAVVLLEDWRVGLGLVGFAAVAAVTIVRMRNSAVPQATAQQAARADMYGEIEERLAGAEDLRANGAGGHAVRRLQQAIGVVYRASRRARRATLRIHTATTAVFVAGGAMSLAAGTALFRMGAISLGTVYLLLRYTDLLRAPLEALSSELQNVQAAVAGYTRIERLLAERPTVADTGKGTPPAGALSVELKDVSFGYDSGVPVLDGVSVRVPPGGVLGVVGRSGSGKTTLARLLLRLADPTRGAVRVGGTDLRELRLAELRARVGFVTQDVQLLQGSVRDNLTLFGAHPAADPRLVEVLDSLGLGRWYGSLPRGLDTSIGAGGIGLSAGEAQLLAFARVFLRDPGLVILDEAASRLDPVSEERIERAIDRLLRGRTAIVIAHRLATVSRADEILVLDRGRVAEHGPRRVLAGDPDSRFARLLATGTQELPR